MFFDGIVEYLKFCERKGYTDNNFKKKEKRNYIFLPKVI